MKRTGIKRLYHEDGRAYNDAEYEVYEQEQAERKAFRIRILKDFGVIFLLCYMYKYGHSLYSNGTDVFVYPVRFAIILAFLSLPNSIITTIAFVITIRKMKSRFWFLLISLVLPFFMIYWEDLTSGFVFFCYGGDEGVCLYEDGHITWAGIYHSFFWGIYWLMPFVALSFFLYNPFKNMKK